MNAGPEPLGLVATEYVLVHIAAPFVPVIPVVAVVHSSATGDLAVENPRHSVSGSAVLAAFHGGHGPQERLLVGSRGQVRPEFERMSWSSKASRKAQGP